MRELLEGYERFRALVSARERALLEELELEQKPETLVVTCIDSRVDPAKLFTADPGKMLVVRNVANLVPPYAPDSKHHSTSASLEFGVNVVNVKHIFVLGHSHCGGAHSLLEGAPANAQEFVAPWMSIADAARAAALQCDDPGERQKICEYGVVKVGLANLMTYPWIKAAVEAKQIKLHGGWLDIRTYELMLMQPDGSFVSALQAKPERTSQTDDALHKGRQVAVMPPP